MTKKLQILKILTLWSFIILNYHIYNNQQQLVQLKPETIINRFFSYSNVRFSKNYVWMVNNNVIQYSSYILRKKTNDSNTFSIRTSIVLDSDRLTTDLFKNSTFVCLLKSIKNGKIIEIPATEVITLIHQRSKKVYCSLDNVFKIENLLVACSCKSR